jgi:hypothetical protein
MNIADDGPAAGASIVGVLYAIGHIAVVVSKWLKERERKRAMSSVPPTALPPPPPAVDRAVLARLDRAEQHDALVAALFKGQVELVDTQRKLDVLREENYRLAVRDRAKDDEIARLRLKLKADEMAIGVLREQLQHSEQERAQLASDVQRLSSLVAQSHRE